MHSLQNSLCKSSNVKWPGQEHPLSAPPATWCCWPPPLRHCWGVVVYDCAASPKLGHTSLTTVQEKTSISCLRPVLWSKWYTWKRIFSQDSGWKYNLSGPLRGYVAARCCLSEALNYLRNCKNLLLMFGQNVHCHVCWNPSTAYEHKSIVPTVKHSSREEIHFWLWLCSHWVDRELLIPSHTRVICENICLTATARLKLAHATIQLSQAQQQIYIRMVDKENQSESTDQSAVHKLTPPSLNDATLWRT